MRDHPARDREPHPSQVRRLEHYYDAVPRPGAAECSGRGAPRFHGARNRCRLGGSRRTARGRACPGGRRDGGPRDGADGGGADVGRRGGGRTGWRCARASTSRSVPSARSSGSGRCPPRAAGATDRACRAVGPLPEARAGQQNSAFKMSAPALSGTPQSPLRLRARVCRPSSVVTAWENEPSQPPSLPQSHTPQAALNVAMPRP